MTKALSFGGLGVAIIGVVLLPESGHVLRWRDDHSL